MQKDREETAEDFGATIATDARANVPVDFSGC